MSASLKLFALAGAVAVVAAAQPAQAQTHHAHASPRMAPLVGSAQRSLAGANVVGHASPAAPVRVSIFLKPSHQKLLAQMAAQSSARPGLSARMMNLLFRPSATARAQVSAYMRSQGFTPDGQGMLVSSFTGNAAQAERAFGVSLAQYRGADGKAFRAPTSALHLPASIAGDVLSVDGLSTQVLMHPAGIHRKHSHLQPNALTGCGGSNSADSSPARSSRRTSRRPAPTTRRRCSTAATTAPASRSPWSSSPATNTGGLAAFRTCYGITVPNTTRERRRWHDQHRRRAIEVDLDQEVAVSQATGPRPPVDVRRQAVGIAWRPCSTRCCTSAPPGTSTSSRTAGDCASRSRSSSMQAATNQELQLMAVAGMSFFAASGDDGAVGLPSPRVQRPRGR